MTILLEIMRSLLGDLLETLPDDEQTAGVWLAGFCWAMVIFWALLISVTWLHCAAHGSCR